MSIDLATLVAPLRADPAHTALLFDVDGTLAPIVDDPAAARPLPAAVGALLALGRRYRTVAVVSGRPVTFLAEHLPAAIDLSGLYGLEWRRSGVMGDHPEAARWRPVVADAVERLSAEAPDGTVVEPKGLSITLHYRNAPDTASAVRAIADAVAADVGLRVHAAKMSVELHPPIDVDKGTAVLGLAEGAAAALYVGDDVGDLPAFQALRDLRASGVFTSCVAVGGSELPVALAEAADLVLPEQAAIVDLLGALLPDGS